MGLLSIGKGDMVGSMEPPAERRPYVRVNITLPEDLLERVDRAAEGKAISRSTAIRLALAEWLKREAQ